MYAKVFVPVAFITSVPPNSLVLAHDDFITGAAEIDRAALACGKAQIEIGAGYAIEREIVVADQRNVDGQVWRGRLRVVRVVTIDNQAARTSLGRRQTRLPAFTWSG